MMALKDLRKKIKGINFPLKHLFMDIFGSNVYLVGGTVRDFLLYNQIDTFKDIDLVVIGYEYDDIERKLSRHGKTNTVGKSFAVVKFAKDGHNFDISIPRRDFKEDPNSSSHKNFLIEHGPHISLEEDLKRRDFSCNSIAVRLLDHEIVDPFNGIKALQEKKMVMTDCEFFFDDPLRILRGARFASVHQFKIDQQIYHLSKDVNLDELSVERIQEELIRLLLESEQPSLGLSEYFKLSVLEKLFPELYPLTVTIQDALFHPETDEYGHHTVWAHTLITIDIAKALCKHFVLDESEQLVLLLAALMHDIGKAETTRWEHKRGRMTVTSISHDTRGVKIADQLLSRLKIKTRNGFPVKQSVLKLIKNHHRLFEFYRNREKIGFKSITRLINDLDGRDLLLLLLDFADRQSRESVPLSFTNLDKISQWYLDIKEELDISKETIEPILKGRDLIKLGISPGKKMGEYLHQLYELQLDGEFKTRSEGLKLFKKIIPKKAK